VSLDLIRRSGYERRGFAEQYDDFRPAPPVALLDALLTHAGLERPLLVVDLGCGTGLSTRAWASRAVEVVGVEPNPAMRGVAEARTGAPNVRYVEAYANATGLPGACADVVTCSQSFHWMEPEPTLAEAARVLRPAGVFAAYDYDVIPVVHWEIEAAFDRLGARRRELRRQLGLEMGADRWPKHRHLARIRASGHFRVCRELVVHGTVLGGVARIVGLALSIGPALDGIEPALAELRRTAERVLGEREVPLTFGYRARVGIK
jgi:ubiquinone/menaquinone biosynthesis C-methylase UbiE